MNKVEINIPLLPPKEVSPNFRGHWHLVSQAKRTFKEATRLSIPLEARSNPPKFASAKLSVSFTIPDRRHYKDTDNALACLKSAIDACVVAGILVDDKRYNLSLNPDIEWVVDKNKAPLTTLTFEKIKR